ncbi:hypothetical protein AAW31_14960 [Nitrosomonas communis]|uniref:Uncharacterized protein n=1 Tax=Nitrosomonas communis TaxID=44574 RepID=A0A0F7KH25_9PROT|nr:hypothetical protein AAW31_14960 [Nitrosomonas communis]
MYILPAHFPVVNLIIIPFLNQKWRKDELQTVSMIRQGEVDKVRFNLEMELRVYWLHFIKFRPSIACNDS